MRKIREALRLRYEHGASQHEIGRSVGIVQSTAGEILRRSEAAGLVWPLPESLSDEDLDRLLYSTARPATEAPRPLPDWRAVDRELSRKGVTLVLLWFEYKAEYPDGYGYSRFADLYRAWKGRTDLRMLQRHKAGEKVFVDFAGLTMPVTDPATGQVREVPVFVSAMGASQRIFANAYESQTSESWLRGLEDAFVFYGALPQVVVPDNPKPCVTDPDRFEPVVNPAFADFARFYELAVIPARVRKPRDKAKVENGVQQVERWVLAPLRNQTFFSLEELREAMAAKIQELDVRVMKGQGVSRRELFAEVDRPAMRDLPEGRYRYATWKKAKVAPDYHVEFEGHRYSVPSDLVGRPVEMRIALDTLEIFLGTRRVYTHPRSFLRWGFTTEPAHMPSHHRQYAEWTPERIERWALAVGPRTCEFVGRILRAKVHPEQAFKSCMGVISLGKGYGKDRLEAACLRALTYRAYSYRNVKTILEKGLDGKIRRKTDARRRHARERARRRILLGGEPMRQLTLDKLAELHLGGMRKALQAQTGDPKTSQMEFEDRLLMLLDAESFRKQKSLEWRLKRAGLRQNVRAEELDFRAGRKFDRTLFERLLSGEWLRQKRNVIITGPTGIGKTFLASALAHQACQTQLGARYFRTPRLLAELGVARGQGTMRTKLSSLARVDLIVLDDWLLAPLSDLERRDLLEIVDDRYEKRSTLICAQLPLEHWHDAIGDPTLADAILDRLIHNAYRLELEGGSMRKARGLTQAVGGNIDPS